VRAVRELDEQDGLIVFDRCSDLGAVPQRLRKVIARRLEIVDFERDVDVADWIVELRCRPLCSQLGARLEATSEFKFWTVVSCRVQPSRVSKCTSRSIAPRPVVEDGPARAMYCQRPGRAEEISLPASTLATTRMPCASGMSDPAGRSRRAKITITAATAHPMTTIAVPQIHLARTATLKSVPRSQPRRTCQADHGATVLAACMPSQDECIRQPSTAKAGFCFGDIWLVTVPPSPLERPSGQVAALPAPASKQRPSVSTA
jgi:hypothetical protein